MADVISKQYDRVRASKEVLKEVQKTAAGNLTSKLNTQFAMCGQKSSKNAWFPVQSNLPRNLRNFTVRYLNKTLPHLSNMHTWGLAETKLCPLCNIFYLPHPSDRRATLIYHDPLPVALLVQYLCLAFLFTYIVMRTGASANKLRVCSASQKYMIEPKFKRDRPRTSSLRIPKKQIIMKIIK